MSSVPQTVFTDLARSVLQYNTTGVLVCCSCSYHVLESSFEVPSEGTGLVTLDLTVLDRCCLQVIVHLHGKNGRRATLILSTL